MRKLKQYKLLARAPKHNSFGQFKIIEVDKRTAMAKADFGDGCVVDVDVSSFITQLRDYAPNRKTFYVVAL